MRHVLFIDPLEKLNISKDSSLMFALSLQEKGHETYLLFEKDFYFTNSGEITMNVYSFSGSFKSDECYIENFNILDQKVIELGSEDTIHMRIDPPFDTRYMRYLWMLRSLKRVNVKVLNNPDGILLFNEKLCAYEHKSSLPSYIGSSESEFINFATQIYESGNKSLILKPLDLYQGIGVEKLDIGEQFNEEECLRVFKRKVDEYKGPVIVQPFEKTVTSGEVRSIYYQGKEIGSILKVPQDGEWLANIAMGAKYQKYDLSKEQRKICDEISLDLLDYGVDWIAFDILGNSVSEVNITCPGLLVEVSKAYGKNLAYEIINLMS